MAMNQVTEALQQLRSAVLQRDGAALTDAQLLECFLVHGDEAAVAALVRRHGPMVWGVCRRVLGSHHDAEDAFQATFLVLVRKAASIKPREKLVNWLYGVACQTARKARATLVRRRQREMTLPELPEPAVPEADPWRELRPVLDRELGRLPGKYRAALLLCDVEGLTRKEAAQRLGLPAGTLSGHLTRGRTLLAARLTRQGLALSGGALAAVLARQAAAAPAALVASTIRAATPRAGGVVSPAVAHLTREVLRTMLLSKLKFVPVLLTALALVLSLAVVDPRTWANAGTGGPADRSAPAAGRAPDKGPSWHATLTIKHEHPVALVACGADWSAAADEGGNLFLWETRSGKGRELIIKGGKGQGLNASVERLQLTPDGQYLFAVLGGRRALFRFKLREQDRPGHGLAGRDPAFLGVSADGETWLEAHGAGRTLTLRPNVWTQPVGAVQYETIDYEAKITHAVVSPDGQQLAVVTADGSLHVHERASLRKTQTITVPKQMVTDLQFSPDGKRLAVVAQDSSAKVYDPADGQEVAALKGHSGIVFAVAFSPDGKTVATGGDDNTARLWDAASGRAVAVLKGHTDSVRSVAFDPAGRLLFTGSADGTVKVWNRTR
jgi:RNA polymerase sigma factor (sigma-70 family)